MNKRIALFFGKSINPDDKNGREKDSHHAYLGQVNAAYWNKEDEWHNKDNRKV